MPRPKPWPQWIVQATQINMATRNSMACGHQHGFTLQHRPWIFTWHFMATEAKDINTDSGHRLRYGSWLQHKSRYNSGLSWLHRPLRKYVFLKPNLFSNIFCNSLMATMNHGPERYSEDWFVHFQRKSSYVEQIYPCYSTELKIDSHG